MLNAKRLDSEQLIILAIEDTTRAKVFEEQLVQLTKNQEGEIVERTKQLADKVEELELVNNNMVGRELKMVELKKEIAELKKKYGEK